MSHDVWADARRWFVTGMSEKPAPPVVDRETWHENYQRWRKVFKRFTTYEFLRKSIREMLYAKIRTRSTFKAIGVGPSDLAGIVERMVAEVVIGHDRWWGDVDPEDIPDAGEQIMRIIGSFDPFTFVWPVDEFRPKVREAMRACGLFLLSDGSGTRQNGLKLAEQSA